MGDVDFGILVSLSDDAAVALGHVSGPPGRIHVHQVNGPVLDIGSDTHFLCGANQDGYVPVATGSKEPALLGIVFGLVYEAHFLSRHTAAY